MLVIRLTRTGKTSQESFRMVVAEQSKAVKRQYLELVGHYAPTVKPKVLKFDKDRILYWISKGAKPSETVASLLKAEGVPDMDKYIHFTTDRKGKKKKAAAEEPAKAAPAAAPKAAEEAPAAPAPEAPAAPAPEVKAEEVPAAPVEEAPAAPAPEVKTEEAPAAPAEEPKTEEVKAEEPKEEAPAA